MKATCSKATGPTRPGVIDGETARQNEYAAQRGYDVRHRERGEPSGIPSGGEDGDDVDVRMHAPFIGYSPHLCTGVWVGFDQRTSLGRAESGGRVALPIWMNFMATALKRFPPEDFAPPVEISPATPSPGQNAEPEPFKENKYY